MQIHFEVAEKQADGQVLTQYNPGSGCAEIIHWQTPPENVPSFIPGTSHVIIKAVEPVLVPSIWKGFMGAAGNGISSGLDKLTNKINSMFNQQQMQPQVQPGFEQPNQSVNKTPFRPTEVHTGVKVIMPRDKILKLTTSPKLYQNGLFIVGGDIVEYSSISVELSVWVYNMLSTDVTLQCGDEIALGYFLQVESSVVNNIPRPMPMDRPVQTQPVIGRAPIPGIQLNK